MDNKLNRDGVLGVIEMALEKDLTLAISIHGLSQLDEAIDLAEQMCGARGARINHQPGCYVIRAEARKGTVDLYIPKTPFDAAVQDLDLDPRD